MSALSYLWHGIILSDFERLNRPRGKLLIYSTIISSIVAFVIINLFELDIMEKHFKRSPLLRGLLAGAVSGVLYFLVSKVFGFSFATTNDLKQMLVDLVWQVFEQSIGGILVGMVYVAMYNPEIDD